MLSLRPARLAPALLVMALTACGDSKKPNEKPGAPAPAPAASAPAAPAPAAPSAPAAPAIDPSKGSCEVVIDGDLKGHALAPGGPQAVGTDYWVTPEELDQGIETMISMIVRDKKKLPAAIAKAKKNDPKIMLLVLTCNDNNVNITLAPGPTARYVDVPFGPGTYKITADGTATSFGALFKVANKFFRVDGTGTLEITRFDKRGITASFEFAAQNTDKFTKAVQRLTVKGKLDYPCPPTSKACQP